VILGFVSVPVLVTGLGYAGYGVYGIVFAIAGYGAFLDLGFGWAGVRFTAEAHARRDRDGAAGVLWALVLYQALSGGVVLALLVAGADRVGRGLMRAACSGVQSAAETPQRARAAASMPTLPSPHSAMLR
jgi:O-antigen/teichoic acid export membrane protein